MKSLETIAAIICVFVLLFVVPVTLNKMRTEVTEESIQEKASTQLAYKIENYKEIRYSDLYNYTGTITAYSDEAGGVPIMVTFGEICDAMKADADLKYVFTEKYVQLEYGKNKVWTLRVN